MANQDARCPNCGAPLEVSKGATDVACRYCGTAIRVERTRKLPPPELAKPQTVYVKSGLPGFILWIIILTGIVPAFIPVFIFLGPMLAKAYESRFGSLPMVCGMNDDLEIVGKEFSGSGSVVVAELNCKLRIRDSKLSGDVVVESKGNLELTIENSTLEGRDAALKLDNNANVSIEKGSAVKSPETAIVGTTNVQVKVDGSTVRGGSHAMDLGINGTVVLAHQASLASDGPAVSGEMNLEATLDESKIDSKDVAISGGANTKLKLTRNATLHGARMGVRSGTNLHVALENSTIASEGTAVCAGYNTEVTALHSVISGLPESLRLAGKPNALDLTESSLRGAEVFDAEGCGGGSATTGATAPAPVPVEPVFPHPMPTRAPGLGRTLHVR